MGRHLVAPLIMTNRAFVIARYEAIQNTGSNPEGMARWIASFLAITWYLLLSPNRLQWF
ncbi:MAG: hypothetical protein LBD53_04150 [Tannerella sp.]|nr:hypothetical protein [Tannerella sp.]